jgi:murein DD-endopeptidase MepM/ murein hydrolase activator NlpD
MPEPGSRQVTPTARTVAKWPHLAMSRLPARAYDRDVNAPVARKNLNLTAKWLYSSGAFHAGYDHGAQIGTPVFAVRNGRILKVVDNIANMAANEEGKSGDPPNFIIQGFTYNREPACIVYLHVSPNALVSEGDEVEAGPRQARHQLARPAGIVLEDLTFGTKNSDTVRGCSTD